MPETAVRARALAKLGTATPDRVRTSTGSSSLLRRSRAAPECAHRRRIANRNRRPGRRGRAATARSPPECCRGESRTRPGCDAGAPGAQAGVRFREHTKSFASRGAFQELIEHARSRRDAAQASARFRRTSPQIIMRARTPSAPARVVARRRALPLPSLMLAPRVSNMPCAPASLRARASASSARRHWRSRVSATASP